VPKITAHRQTERRDRILDAAERCFARDGFRGATMAQICADAGVSAGGAYLYFRSKEDLIAGLAERDRERIAQDFARLDEAPDFLAALDGLANQYCFNEEPHRRALMLEIAAEATRNPAVHEQWQRVDRLVRDTFQKALTAQIAAGRIHPRHDAATLAALMMMIGDGMFQRMALDRDFDQQRVMPAMMGLIRELIGADDAAPTMAPANDLSRI
jgi:TetR/AcrR family transcriptional repressor of uid operon